MTFLLDQDVPDDIEFSLSAVGHTVLKLRGILPITASDRNVLRTAAERECVLLTCNRDDFLTLAQTYEHAELGLRGNVNFA